MVYGQVPVISYSSPQSYVAGTPVTPLTPINTGGAVPAAIPGNVTTLAGNVTNGYANGTGVLAQFAWPGGVAADAAGNVYVADTYNNRIRKIDKDANVSTLAGSGVSGSADGNGASAKFKYPGGVVVDAAGNVYVADVSNYRVRKISPAGDVTSLAGSTLGFADGNGSSAQFTYPAAIVKTRLSYR